MDKTINCQLVALWLPKLDQATGSNVRAANS